MPIGYDTKCRSCGEEDGVIGSYWSLRHEGKDIPLPHPEETTYIQKYGYTKLQATLEGRLRDNQAYCCESCKELFYKPSLMLPKEVLLSRKASIVLAVLGIPVVGFALFSNVNRWIIWACAVLFAAIYTAIVGKIEERRLYRRLIANHSPPDMNHCPNCSSDQIKPLLELSLGTGDKMPCKCHKCGAHHLIITSGWLS